MTYEEFRDWLFSKIEEVYPNVIITSLGQVQEYEVVALQLDGTGTEVAPVLSPTEWYEKYEEGEKLGEIWKQVLGNIKTNNELDPAVKIMDSNWVFKNVKLEVLWERTNRLLKDLYIYRRISETDLLLVPIVTVKKGDMVMEGRFTSDLLEMYGKTEDEFFNIAMENTMNSGPEKFDKDRTNYCVGPAVYGCVPELIERYLDNKDGEYYILPISRYYVRLVDMSTISKDAVRNHFVEKRELLKFLGLLSLEDELSRIIYVYKKGKITILR